MTQKPDTAEIAHAAAHAREDLSPYAPLTHHGRTPAAWAGSVGAGIGFVIATIGFVLPGGISVPIVAVGLAIVLLSAGLGLIMRNMGYGTKEN